MAMIDLHMLKSAFSANDGSVSDHARIGLELNQLYAAKNRDYGDSFHKTYLDEGWAMVRIRIRDKFERLCSLTRSGGSPWVQSESLRDTLMDLANYAIMAVIELDKQTREEGAENAVSEDSERS